MASSDKLNQGDLQHVKQQLALHQHFAAPHGFNRENVYGTILNLFKPKDWKFCLPLEIVANNKLLHVVVDSKDNVKPLIDSNAFWGKWTIVPLKDVWVAVPNKEGI